MSEQVRIERGVAVEMRDGVHLATDVYLPEGPGPFPTLVTRIRGARSSGFIVGVLILNPLAAVERGYAVVVQEVRGRAGSEAAWHPFVHELEDGADCLDWVLAQPWCDGSIGTYGTAYSASTALYLSASGRDEVKALAVLGTGADIHDGWVYTSGAFELGWNVYWAYMTAAETIKRLDVDEETRKELQQRVRARDHRGAGGRRAAADLRSPPPRPRRRDAVPRVARPPGLRRLLGVVRRPGADGAAARPDALDHRVARQLPQVALRPLPCSRRSGAAPARGGAVGAHELRLAFLDEPRRARSSSAPGRSRAWRSRRRSCSTGSTAGSRVRTPARPAACATGSSARTSGARPTPGRRRTQRAALAPRLGWRRQHTRRRRHPGARPRRRRRAGRHLPLRPARPRPHGRRQDADADDHDGRDRGPVRGGGPPRRPLLHVPRPDGARRRARGGARRAVGVLLGRRHRFHREARRRHCPTGGPSISPTGSCAPATATRRGAGRSRSSPACRPRSRSGSGISRTPSFPATGSGSRSARATSPASTGT